MTFTIALAQIEVKAGLPEVNVRTILRFIAEARSRGAHLVVFPEMCVGGYFLGDRWLDDGFCRDLMRANETIREASHDITVAWGNVCLDDLEARAIRGWHPNKDGRRRRYNAMYVAQAGEWAARKNEHPYLPRGMHAKTLLPSYRIFDDVRYFFSLQDVAADMGVPLRRLQQPFVIRGPEREVAVGFELCEDLWCQDYRVAGEALNATRMLIANGAEFVANGSSSPWTFGKNGARDRRVKFLKGESGDAFVPYLYVNVVGAQNNGKNVITFDGGSTVYDASGAPIMLAEAPYAEALLVARDFRGPALGRDERQKIAQKQAALVQGLRHLRDTRGGAEHPRFVVGLSGGIDSAVSAALLAEAVGPERVLAVNLPSRFNSSRTIQAAEAVARGLGLRFGTIAIEPLIAVNRALVAGLDLDGTGKALSPLAEENIQAKIRGTAILSNLAARYDCVFSNNGNKLEIALGYATLYGDWGGAISVVGDLTKTEVYDLARHLNRNVYGRDVIPEALIPDALFRFRPDQIEPSAELRENQVDPMKFGYHCAVLDAMTDFRKKTPEDLLAWYLEGTLHEHLGVEVALLTRWGVDRPDAFVADLEWFWRSMQGAVFKRVQAPPIIVTSKSAFGFDIRESMLPPHRTQEARALEARVLALSGYTPARIEPG